MDADRLSRTIRLVINALDQFESDTEDERDERTIAYAKRMVLIRDARGAATELADAITESRGGQ